MAAAGPPGWLTLPGGPPASAGKTYNALVAMQQAKSGVSPGQQAMASRRDL